MQIKRLCPAAACLLLAACAPQTAPAPAHTAQLPASGVTLTLAGCTVAAGETNYFEGDEQAAVPLFDCDAAALLTFTAADGAAPQVEWCFARPEEQGFAYSDAEIYEKVDYVPLPAESGAQYRADTLYSYAVTVTTEAGQDVFILDCRQDG